MKTVAILCGGGPAPGINTVISSVSKAFLKGGYRVLGVHEAYKGLFSANSETIDITYEWADKIYDQGGSAIKMSRFKPKDSDFTVDFFKKNNVDLLVTVGGDDTASTANRITKFLHNNKVEIKNIHVPKTIDNDLPLPEGVPTFGFMSAVEVGTAIGKTIKIESLTTNNWYTVTSMGREAGHLAYEIGKSIQASMIIIPEMFNKTQISIAKIVDLVVSSIIKRKTMGINPGVAVISEGVFHDLTDEDIKSCGIVFSYDDHGHPELSKISKAHIFSTLIERRLEEIGMDTKNRAIELGYSLRCCPPIASDLSYCTSLGYGVKKLYDEGHTGCMVSLDQQKNIIPIYLKDVEDENGKIRPRLVDMDNEDVKSVFETNIYYLQEEDYEKAKKLIASPEDFDYKKILNW
jgi:6-phosphofructokinase 1